MRALPGWLAFVFAGCLLGGYERGGPAPNEEGGAGPEGCLLARPPAPDPGAPDGGDIDFVVAVRTMTWPRFGAPESEETLPVAPDEVGFDLDGRCTCSEGFRTSCLVQADAPLANHCDDAAGRDNSFGFALAPMILVAGEEKFSLYLSSAIDAGQWGHLFEVRGYNGERDDARVWIASHAAVPLGAIGGPQWNGDDVWPLAAAGFADEAEPRFVDPEAYVVDGVLVARFSSLIMRFESGLLFLPVRFVEVELTARIEETPTGIALREGVMAARLTERDAFEAFDAFRYEEDKAAFFCMGVGFVYELSRGAFCRALDLRLADDDATAACDAVSVGLGFSADPARLGSISELPATLPVCAPGTEPAFDRCSY